MSLANFPLLFLQASLSALLTCSLAWCFLRLAQRFWPGIKARRTPWLLAQLAGAATLLILTLPAASHLSLFSVQHDLALTALAQHLPSAAITGFAGHGVDDLSADDQLPAVAWAWLGMYMAGLAWHARKLQRQERTLRTLLSLAQPLDRPALQAHPAFAGHGKAGLPVLELDAPVSPLLAGLMRPVLLLPSHVRELPPKQQQLIVAHELMHLRRRDHQWQQAGTLLQLLLWFVPPAASFRRSLQWAVELGCDGAVLAGRTDQERRSYAAALLSQLAVQSKQDGLPHCAPPALAFGGRAGHSMAERIGLIRSGQSVPRAGIASASALLLLPALCGASVLLQPQFAWNGTARDASPTAGAAWRTPLAQLYVTSAFGSINRPGGKPHNGTDFRAARGTPVFAPASGTVATSTDLYEGGERYGKVVVIEHHDGNRTLFAHLDQRSVNAGDTVRAGQQIALSGDTGKVSGPHLHFEVSRQGRHIDPQAVLKRAALSPIPAAAASHSRP